MFSGTLIFPFGSSLGNLSQANKRCVKSGLTPIINCKYFNTGLTKETAGSLNILS